MFKKAKLQRKIENTSNIKEKKGKEAVQTCRDGIPIKPATLEINSLRALNMSHRHFVSLYFKLQLTEPVCVPATSKLTM